MSPKKPRGKKPKKQRRCSECGRFGHSRPPTIRSRPPCLAGSAYGGIWTPHSGLVGRGR